MSFNWLSLRILYGEAEVRGVVVLLLAPFQIDVHFLQLSKKIIYYVDVID
jgi:hypothetical protein